MRLRRHEHETSNFSGLREALDENGVGNCVDGVLLVEILIGFLPEMKG